MNDFSQKHLLFLISQPRAGSTLTQRILGSHPDVYTTSEPWMMLHPLYALREQGCYMEYSADNSRRALHNFLSLHPQGEESYFRAVGQMYLNLYGAVLEPSQKRFFLDKTPRYYYIIPELYRTFPDAKYIFLLRNPLAILCSILSTFVQENWWTIQYYQGDLLRAPGLIAQGMLKLQDNSQDNSMVLRYEALLTHPEHEIQRVCRFLDLPFNAEIIYYGEQGAERWQFGDQTLIHQESQPNAQNGDRWQQNLKDPIIWQSAHRYLELLGKDLLLRLGYAYDELKDLLEARKPEVESILPPALEDFFASASIFLDPSLQPPAVAASAPQFVHAYLKFGQDCLQKNRIELALDYLH
ncbi:MAG TPA: sulfotransferase, partial [Allocoleopsis sp.]